MHCDMCGLEAELFRCKIEDTQLNVCRNCGRYGEILHKVKEYVTNEEINIQKKTIEQEETIEVIVSNYSKLVKNKREELGLKQKDFAQKIGEKESVIHNIESGNIEPSIILAKKLEGFLKITLVKEYKEKGGFKKGNIGTLTIGDLIKIKK